MSDEVVIATPDGPMSAFVAAPDGRARGPAVIVAQEAFGVNAHIRDVCGRFAREGFVAIAPELFHRTGPGFSLPPGELDFSRVRPHLASLTNEAIATDVRATLDHLRASPRVDPKRIGIVGFCMGGFVAFLAACRTDVASAVAFYGGGLVEKRPALKLEPPLGEASEITAPILLFFGGEDAGIPKEQIETIRTRLTELGKRYDIRVYPGGKHGFFNDARPDAYHEEAAKDAWVRTLDWFRTTL